MSNDKLFVKFASIYSISENRQAYCSINTTSFILIEIESKLDLNGNTHILIACSCHFVIVV